MKQVLLFFILLFCSVATVAQLKSGMLLGGGAGHLDAELGQNAVLGNVNYVDYRFNAMLGYRFRILPKQSLFFYDIDVNAGMKGWQFASVPYENINGENHYPPWWPKNSYSYYYTSLSGAVNYKVYKKLSAGVGLEPTMYFRDGEAVKWKFDVPVALKAGYDFGPVELGVAYKFGISKNVLKTNDFESGRFNDWQVSLFIPF